MTTSSSRTLILRPEQHAYGIAMPVPRLQWPEAGPDDDLDYSTDLTTWLADCGDALATASWSATGGLQIANLSVAGGVATGWFDGFVAGATHLVKCEFTTTAGRIVSWVPRIQVRPIARQIECERIGCEEYTFGTPATWNQAPFSLNDGFIVVANNPGFPTSSAGLWPGACWVNNGFLAIMPGVTPSASAPPVFYAGVTAGQFLWYGGGYLPLTSPTPGSGIVWNNGGFGCVA